MANWANMSKDLVTKIAEHVKLYEDFETLRWICSSWRLATKEAHHRACVNSDEHRVPWLMLPPKRNNYSKRRHLYSFSRGKVRCIDLPHSKDNFKIMKMVLSSHGWYKWCTIVGLLEEPRQDMDFSDGFYTSEFYGVEFRGMIVKFGTAQGSPRYQMVTKLDTNFDNEGGSYIESWCHYLVESLGQLLVVRQALIIDKINLRRWTKRFEVLELNVKDGQVKKVQSLGNRAIFVGMNSSFSVDVSGVSGFKPNCIYNTDDRVTKKWSGCKFYCSDTCIYNLTDGRWYKLDYGSSIRRKYCNGKRTPVTWIESPII
uniref:KIB1-4 beta-propeller domain-containing protein n=1 Tax=Chenopodium quinoa TaxID=63459 RepID=A0A803LWA2_CHEQI